MSTDVEERARYVDAVIKQLKGNDNTEIVVLTCATMESTLFGRYITQKDEKSYFRTGIKVPVHTCRKFKGLEADAIILIDVDQNLWLDDGSDYKPKPGLLFYKVLLGPNMTLKSFAIWMRILALRSLTNWS